MPRASAHRTPLPSVETPGRKAILISDLELDRARREAQVETVISYSEVEKRSAGKRKQKTRLRKSAGGIPKKPRRSRDLDPDRFSPAILRVASRRRRFASSPQRARSGRSGNSRLRRRLAPSSRRCALPSRYGARARNPEGASNSQGPTALLESENSDGRGLANGDGDSSS